MNSRFLKVFCGLFLLTTISWSQTFDDKWVFSANGQSVRPLPDGRIVIPNVSAPDLFGPEGPGTSPDFVSDDFIRVIGIRHESGTNLYAFSDFFRIRQGAAVAFGKLTFTAVPPRKPSSLLIIPQTRVMTNLDQINRLQVLARFPDGTTSDVTSRSAWTTYRVNNPALATVSPEGEVVGIRTGRLLVTAVNEGASAVAVIDISPGDRLTTLVGLVVDRTGAPLGGATVRALETAVAPVITAADGSFAISNVATAITFPGVVAYKFAGVYVFGGTTNVTLVAGGITDLGLISVDGKCLGCVDTDNDQLPDLLESALGTSSTRSDSDNDGLTDLFEVTIAGTDPNRPDSDNNGVRDAAEDFDLDSLPNQQEQTLGTHPWLSDTDGDGWPEETEVTAGSNPLSAASRPFLQLIAQPSIGIILPGFSSVTSLGPNTAVALPPITLLLPSVSDARPSGSTVARPPVTVLAPGLGDPELTNIWVAQPPLTALLLSAVDPVLAPNVQVARPPLKVTLPSSSSGILSNNVTVAQPPANLRFNPQ